MPKLTAWIAGLDVADPDFEHLRLEGLWTYQALDVVEPNLLTALLHAKDHHVRAAATRVLEQWHPRLDQTAALLAEQVDDPHPQVRLEAVRALTSLRTAPAAELATHVLDHPIDRFLDHALWLTSRDLQPYWLPALQAGQLSFGGNAQHVAYVLQAAGSPGVVGPLMDLLRSGKLPAERRESTLQLIAALGGPPELRVVFDMALDAQRPAVDAGRSARGGGQSHAHPQGATRRRPAISDRLGGPTGRNARASRRSKPRGYGDWKLRERLQQFASSDDTSPAVRRQALDGLAALGRRGGESVRSVASAATGPGSYDGHRRAGDRRRQGCRAEAVALMRKVPAPADPESIITAMLDRKAGTAALVEALSERKLPEDAAKLAVRRPRDNPRRTRTNGRANRRRRNPVRPAHAHAGRNRGAGFRGCRAGRYRARRDGLSPR